VQSGHFGSIGSVRGSAAAATAIDRRALVRGYARAAATYDAATVLEREIARRMSERLQYVRLAPQRVLDLGSGTGADMPLLRKTYPHASVVAADLSLAMLRRAAARKRRGLGSLFRAPGQQRVCCDAALLPFGASRFELVWSNELLHWLSDPLPVLSEAHRVLAVDGLFMFSTLGPDTLKELRRAFGARADARVHRFTDMHDVGDMLVEAGFADPVMDMEILTFTYGDFSDLVRDLRQTGAVNRAACRTRGLTGRGLWQEVRRDYETFRREGRLPASFEVVYGHAWKVAPRSSKDGSALVHFHSRPRVR
jgi:malonyl-CoA O-methyltransferase